jgi:TPR repeat protein
MKQLIAALALSLLSAAASADELADGIKAWEARDFAAAQKVFAKLANAGNPEAQLLLGEMYGFGEGVPEDRAQAERWIGQARANGHKDAAASLETIGQRNARKADIARYVSGFDIADLRLAKFGCTTPVLPEVSKTQAEVKAADAAIKDWRACYERFGAHLAAQMPAGKAIAPDIAKLMSLVELERARATMDKAYAAAADNASREALAFTGATDAWYSRTKQYAIAQEKMERDETSRRQRERDELQARARATVPLPNPSTTVRK